MDIFSFELHYFSNTKTLSSMTNYICTTCGVQYEAGTTPPLHCPICEDDRQYVNPGGQGWTSLKEVAKQHRNIIEKISPDLYAIYTAPKFGIGQRAYLVISPGGNVLWDCITLLDPSTIDIIEKLGGIKAIVLSHPHYFSTIVEWSEAFQADIYVHAEDAGWLGRRNDKLRLWEGDIEPLWDQIKIVRCGGHFPGACILHWPVGDGTLLVGDTIQVSPNLTTVSFMYSYPNNIPLPKKDILAIAFAVKLLQYNVMHGAFGLSIRENATAVMERSVQRYLQIYQ